MSSPEENFMSAVAAVDLHGNGAGAGESPRDGTHEEDPQAEKRRSVRFAPPRDVVSERVTFDASGSTQPVSVEGIVEYGAPLDSIGEMSVTKPDRRKSSFSQQSRRSSQRSSLELRKSVPESMLLNNDRSVIEDMGGAEKLRRRRSTFLGADGCFHRLFLNPNYSLRKQMLLTFGTVSSLTILLVMLVSITATVSTGHAVKEESSENIERWVIDFVGDTSRFVAKALSPKIMPNDLVDLMVEIARDRFAGYPTAEDDSLTPFFDTRTQTNIYPLKNNPLPMDWDYRLSANGQGNVNEQNYAEHVQDRWPWYSTNPRLSTAVAMYTMQGACDPSAKPGEMSYYANCTDASNSITSGGIIAPNPTNAQVYRKAADMSPFMKALYEYHQEIMSLGYYFSNSGAGSSIFFPHYELDASGSYESVGCEWMRAPNPINATLGPIGTDEEIARCHPAGTMVPTREYNPLERAWCRDEALNPQRIYNAGPYLNAFSSEKMWIMSTGRAVYDLVTGAFVSCISIDFSIDGVNEILEEVKVEELGILTLVRNDEDGTVVTSPKFDLDVANGTTTITDPALETGVDEALFDQIKTIVDFSQPWDPNDASKAYERAIVHPDGTHIIAAYPIPSIPSDYDPAYTPEFFAIFSLPMSEGLAPIIENVSEDVDQSVQDIILFTIIIGLIGLAVVILLIFATASWFVGPLKWMQDVGDQVVGNFGEELDDSGIDYERKKSKTCLPKTELNSLAEEFSKMVARFSGEGTAKRMQATDTEKVNVFDFTHEFADLYRSRTDGSFAFNYLKASPADGQEPQQCNLGPNVRSPAKSETTSSVSDTNEYNGKVHKSPLFLWMVAFIVGPTLITTVVISGVVLWQNSHQLPSLIVPVKEEYLDLMDAYRYSAAGMLAIRTQEVTEKAARDTHLLTRVASWLFFGGMDASDSFAEVIEGAEECKTAPSEDECEWEKALPCDCAWNSISSTPGEGSCTEYPAGKSRYLQKPFFVAQSENARPDGSRFSTSYPDVARFPNATAWWDNTTVLPRMINQLVSSKYATSWSRVKILSALSTAMIPLYNYDKSINRLDGLYVGFEADGMLAGYNGCNPYFASYPFWRSTQENGAESMRPELCPVNKYGYDARCRGWYHDGKRKAEAANGTLHITSPYVYNFADIVGQSITSPLIDPANQRHIGQVLVDFLPDSIFRALASATELSEGEYTILITPDSDVPFAPGFYLDTEGKEILDLLNPDDAFQPILQNMKAGNTGYGTFTQTAGPNGDEIIHIAYAPVYVRNYYPLNSSDMSSGVTANTTLVYSIALAESESDTLKPFQSINDFTSKTVNICIGVLAAIIAISTLLIIYIAFRVTQSMIIPILKLFDVIKDINCMRTSEDDITKLSSYKGSCQEVDSVYKTMEMLYKVVQFANIAFFSGDLEVAYQVLRDALRLFTRLDNKKAIAVASNNLGNTMLTIFRTMKAGDCEEMCGLSKAEVIEKGTAYFAYSIKLGEEAYDQFYNDQGWSEECLVFMQFLANRYFNRAMFFLTTSCDSENRKEAESLGFRDLQITGDMDIEIVDQCLEMGFKINRVERFELMMSRVRGLLALVDLGYNPEELFVEDQINDLFRDLKTAMKDPANALFEAMSVAGRMQKLDIELMKYCNLAKNDHVNAARVASRMLIEDEYIFPDAEHEATKMLLIYLKASNDKNCPKDEDGCIAKELGLVVHSFERDYIRRSQNLSQLNASTGSSSKLRGLGISITELEHHGPDKDLEESMKRRSSAVRESLRFDVTMERF